MVSTNTTTTSQITSEVKDIDFITKFEKRWQSLVEILGIMRPIKKMAGTKLVSSKATIVMQSGVVEEGEEIPLSQAVIEPIVYKDIKLEKYRKRVTAEAVAKYGASVAVAKTDSAFVEELTSGVLDKFYAFLQSGTLTGSESDFQMALAMAVARVKDKFKKMRLDYDNIVVFANTLDVGEYLGGAKITLQNRDGIEYIKDFMGARTIIVSSEIPKGKIIATPADNIVMYYIDPSESQFEELGLEYSTGVSPLKLIGAHREGLFDRASGDIFAILGITLFAEYIDAICVMSIGGASGGITPFSVGDTIDTGTTYVFDKSKGSDIEAMLNGLTYEIHDGIGIIDLLETFRLDDTSTREPTLIALSIDGAKGLFVTDSDSYVPIYVTEDFYVLEGFINAKKGWNIEGDSYTLLNAVPSSIQSILETTPAWNGVIVGLDNSQVPEAPTFLYNLVPSEMTIQENNDGSRSYIKNIDGTIDNMLVGETYNITFEVNGETLTRVGKVTEGNGIQILMNELGNGSINIIGDTTDYVSYGHYLNIGLENGAPVEGKNAPFIVTNGIYKENTPTVKVISYTKQVQEQLALTAFKNGDVVQNGTRLIFPKSQMDNLEALIRDIVANWTYGEDFNMLDENESSGGLLNIMNSGDVFYSLIAPAPSDNVFSGLLWANSDYPDAGITAGWQYQNFVDEGDNYVFIVGEGISNTVNATETDFDGKAYLDQWNGIMIGLDNSQVQ